MTEGIVHLFSVLSSQFALPSAQRVFRRREVPRERASPYNGPVSAVHAGLYISLNQCSLSPGLEELPGERDRLASDEPNVWLTSPT
jgi:hypothetical protein